MLAIAPTLLIHAIAGFAIGQLPDELDLLRGVNRRPQVALLLDESGSMGGGSIGTNCIYYAATYNGGVTNLSLNRNQMLEAVLTGCVFDNDGIIDKWSSLVDFAVLQFPAGGFTNGVLQNFGSNATDLQTAVLSLNASGGSTPMTRGLADAGRHMQGYFTDGVSPNPGPANTLSCRPNFVLLLSDGFPNGSPATYDFACGGAIPNVNATSGQPEDGSQYLASADMLCAVNGDQRITTHTIGFAAGSAGDTKLQQVAASGGGLFFPATDTTSLDVAFNAIIGSIVARTAVFYSAPAVQREGLFAGNYLYTSAYRPEISGRWKGNVKKLCVFPPVNGASGLYQVPPPTGPAGADDCMLISTDGRSLDTNPLALDQWNLSITGTTTADIGGAGQRMFDQQLGQADTIPSGPTFRPRNIVTWRPGSSGYVAVQPSSWSDHDAWVGGYDRYKLLNLLHGYTYDADAATFDPIRVSKWPLADPVHSPTVLLRYGSCETPDNCWVAVADNGGMLHLYDAANGDEAAALVIGELWQPNDVARNLLRDLPNQPDTSVSHRYYVDGGMRLYHNDRNADGIIQSNEDAALIFGLGRGGRAYYLLDVKNLRGQSGVLSAGQTPIRPLPYSPGTELRELRDTWAAPWIGLMKVSSGVTSTVAVFPSGHIAAHDQPTQTIPTFAPGTVTVSALNPPAPSSALCTSVVPPALGVICSAWVPTGYPDPLPIATPSRIGPFSIPNAIAYRLRFPLFELHQNDQLILEDTKGRQYVALTGTGIPAETWSQGLDVNGYTPWIYDTSFVVRLQTDGAPQTERGFVLPTIEYITASQAAPAAHNPTVYVVDMSWWNAPGRNFQARATNGGVIKQFTRACPSGAPGGTCEDPIVNSNASDLQYMTCPISAEVSVYTTADALDTIYWGDECGQIFKAWRPSGPGTGWHVRRLLNLNSAATLNSQSGSTLLSKNFRKIFRKLDIVASTCPGRRVVGIYFGTGDVQRPASNDELVASPGGTGTAAGRDIVGVLWDDNTVSSATLADLDDVSSITSVDARSAYGSGRKGWYWQLAQNERMLRNPVTFQGITLFKTFLPTQVAGECTKAAGLDYIYAVNNCSASVVSTGNPLSNPSSTGVNRVVWSASTDIGGDILVLTPQNGAPLVTHGSLASQQSASLTPTKLGPRIPYIYHWRIPRGF